MTEDSVAEVLYLEAELSDLSAVRRDLAELQERYDTLAKPVPCKGFQKLWNLPPEVERQVLAQL